VVCDGAFDNADGGFAAKPFGQRQLCRISLLPFDYAQGKLLTLCFLARA
jgi:hypothetical protein